MGYDLIKNKMKILAVIPARAGSKGIPNKNIRLIHNKPLIYCNTECTKLSLYNRCCCFYRLTRGRDYRFSNEC